MDAKSRPTFKEIVQQLEESLAFPLSNSSKFSNLCSESWRCPVVFTWSNPCSKTMVEARSEEFLLKSDRPEENNHTKCNLCFHYCNFKLHWLCSLLQSTEQFLNPHCVIL